MRHQETGTAVSEFPSRIGSSARLQCMKTMTMIPFTRGEYELLPESYPAELIGGYLVKEPAPTFWHQEVLARLFLAFRGALPPGRVQFAPLDFFIDDENILRARKETTAAFGGRCIPPGLRRSSSPTRRGVDSSSLLAGSGASAPSVQSDAFVSLRALSPLGPGLRGLSSRRRPASFRRFALTPYVTYVKTARQEVV